MRREPVVKPTHKSIVRLIAESGMNDPQLPWDEIMADLEDVLGESLLEGIEERIALLAKQSGLPEETIKEIAESDPSGGKCLTWLVKQVKNGGLTYPEDADKVRETLSSFTTLKTKPAFQGEKDINKYAEFSELYDITHQNREVKTKGETQRELTEKGVKCLAGDKENGVYEVSTSEAGAKLFRDTAWCVKDPKFFKGYKPSVYHMLVVDGKPFALYHENSSQFKSANDGQISFKAVYPYLDLLKAAGIIPSFAQMAYKVGPKGGVAINRVMQTLSVLAHGDGEDLEKFKKAHGIVKGDCSDVVNTMFNYLTSHCYHDSGTVPAAWTKRYGGVEKVSEYLREMVSSEQFVGMSLGRQSYFLGAFYRYNAAFKDQFVKHLEREQVDWAKWRAGIAAGADADEDCKYNRADELWRVTGRTPTDAEIKDMLYDTWDKKMAEIVDISPSGYLASREDLRLKMLDATIRKGNTSFNYHDAGMIQLVRETRAVDPNRFDVLVLKTVKTASKGFDEGDRHQSFRAANSWAAKIMGERWPAWEKELSACGTRSDRNSYRECMGLPSTAKLAK